MPLQVILPGAWVVSTDPEAALARGKGWKPWQGRGWAQAPRDREPGAGGGVYALGIEPANCSVLGRAHDRAEGRLPFLQPGEKRSTRIAITAEEVG